MTRFGGNPEAFFRAVYEGPAPWDIGGPQPALVQLIAEFPLHGPVLDVGSGSGDLSIWIATQGLEVLGVDFVPDAVERSRARAVALPEDVARRLEFRVGNALEPAHLGRQFGSVVDSGFYHLFEPGACARFAEELAAAISPGGRYYVLAFAVDLPSPDVPRGITEAELLANFAARKGWTVRALRAAVFESRVASVPAICACFERTAG
jgi:SAM-dependent methyltransferase